MNVTFSYVPNSDHLSCRVRIEVLLRSFVVTQAKLLTNKQVVMKKALGETQTLPVRRSQKKCCPPQTPSRVRRMAKI